MEAKKHLDILSFLKMSVIMNPIYSNVFIGKVDILMKCSSLQELLFCIFSTFTSYLTTNTNPYEERLEVFNYFCKVCTTPQISSLVYVVKENDKELLVSLYYLLEQFKVLNTNPDLKSFLYKVEMLKQQNPFTIDQLLNPLLPLEHPHKILLRKRIIEKLSKATSNQLKQIVDYLHLQEQNSFDFQFNIKELSLTQLQVVNTIISK